MTAIVFAASFIALYAGHMIGDFILQTHAWSQGKAKAHGWLAPMLAHVTTYGVAQCVAVLAVYAVTDVHTSPAGWLGGVGFSLLTHGFIDRRWPVRWLLDHTGSKEFAALASGGVNGMFLADQALHVGCLFISALIMGGLA